MRKFVIGAIVAVLLALGFTAGNASADWVTRTRYRWDPLIGQYVAIRERVWVPEVVVPAPVYPAPGVYVDFYGYRPWYLPGYYHHHHHHHHHHY